MGSFELFFIILCSLVHAIGGSPFLLFANRKDIRLIDAEARRKNVSNVIISHLEDAAALDFYYAEEKVFWADVGLEEIKGMTISDAKSNRSIVSTGLISPDGLACDWLSKKLYWTDSETNRIEVSNFDGSHRKVLFWKDLDQPRAIVLVPMDGWMFWTDWGEYPKIEKAGMDGNHEQRKVIVKDNIFWPNGITADYDSKRIYWADAKLKFISSMDFDGEHRTTVVSGNMPHPYALTLYRDMIYWTDWQTRAVHSCNKTAGCSKRTTYGGFLSPMGIHIYLQERQPKAPTPCDHNNGGCSHLCLLSPVKPYYTCACPTGVRLRQDGMTCADGAQELLLLVRRTDLRRISLDTPDYTDVVLELDGIKHAIAVDYDPVDEYMYWSDDEARTIRRAFLNGTGQEDLVTTEVNHPDGIAVDWIARNLYWTDTGTDRIEVARLNGSSRRILISENLDEPRAIVLDPPEGYMYWTDWGEKPKIERAALDGSFRAVLINTSLGWPNGLSIDYEERKLYWGDAKTDKIEMSNLDGTDRRVLVSDQLPHIFGFTSLGQHIYWTDWQRRSIERVDKITGIMREVIVDQLPDLMGLKAVNVKNFHGTNKCAGDNGNCSHLCLNRPLDDYVCSCPMGLELATDNMSCVVPEAFLLFSRRDNIRRISLESNHDDVIPVSGVQEANALDYDINDHRIYWTDTSLKTISRAFINGSSVEPVIEFGLSYPEGMAVDWVAHNLYWTDMGSNRIEVARLDGSSRKVLLWRHMDDPRSLALDPSEGYMYWSDWGTNCIEYAAMDGTHRKVLIAKLGRANGLTIDYIERRLYWIDINALKIESSDLSGNHRVQVIGENLFDPYGLTQYEDYIYWTDWKTNSIEKANKTSGQNRTMIQKNLDHVMDILVFHTSRQSGWNPCAVNNGGCAHLCLALPSAAQHKSYTHNCACPTHYSLAADNKTCSPPKSFILFSQRGSIGRIVLDSLESPDITLPIHGLKNIKAVDYNPFDHFVYWIDGRTKTIKKGFEDGSKIFVVVSNPNDNVHPYDFAIDPFSQVVFWSCSQNNVINVTSLSGNVIGTVIGEAEDRPRFIALHPRKGLLFWTNMLHPARIERATMAGHMRRVLFTAEVERPVSLTVDVQSDLLFWADMGLKRIERAAIGGTDRKVLLSNDLLHPVSITVHDKYLYWIDQDQQIIERINKITGMERQRVQGRMSFLTDLVAVSQTNIQYHTNHPCSIKNGGCSHLCFTENGKKRCACPIQLVLSTDEVSCVDPPTCPLNKFRCLFGVTCIPDAWKCDGVTECEDMSDEMNCPECKSNQFRCENGDCIDYKYRCDSVPHCKDYSDEHCCQKDQFLCSDVFQCIHSAMLCDGKKDCQDGTDELLDNCDGISSQRRAASGQNNASYIVITAVAGVTVLVIGTVMFFCRKKKCTSNENSYNSYNSEAIMASNPLNPEMNYMGNGHSHAFIAPVQQRTTAMTNHAAQHPGSNNQLYDRSHVTGASSTTSSGTYPHETLNPPPSPVTVNSQYMYGYCCPSHSSSSLRSYRHYRSRNRPPPPTPCSTDVCDDSEPYPYRNKYCASGMELSYDSDPFIPPPPTPRSHCLSDDNYDTLLSCPPSPSTERSFYNPHPPPPSPMPESDY